MLQYHDNTMRTEFFLMAILMLLLVAVVSFYLAPERWESLFPQTLKQSPTSPVGRT